MKILHVINSLVAAGAENLVVNLANKQSENNEISIFTFYSEKDVFANKLKDNINLISHKKESYFNFKKIISLYKTIKENDVIHVHLFPSLYIVSFLSFLFKKKKFIYTEHSTHNKRRRFPFKMIEKIVYSNYNSIVCISKGVELELKKWLGNNIKTKIINNFIDLELIEKSSQKPNNVTSFSRESKLLVMVGRFQEPKDHETVIKSLALLPTKYELLLIGEGERENLIKNLARKLNLKKRVHFLGIREDIIEIIKICDYGILSSHWEGFGIVALEYMASDIVAIGSNVSGLKNVIGVKECLFDSGNYKQLSQIILGLEKNKELTLTIKEKQKENLKKYDIKYAVIEYYKVYKKDNKC